MHLGRKGETVMPNSGENRGGHYSGTRRHDGRARYFAQVIFSGTRYVGGKPNTTPQPSTGLKSEA
jgi:hypothetical protein